MSVLRAYQVWNGTERNGINQKSQPENQPHKKKKKKPEGKGGERSYLEVGPSASSGAFALLADLTFSTFLETKNYY